MGTLRKLERHKALLVARKEALFPNDRRLITNYRVSGGGPEDANVVIEYSPPEQV